MAAIVQVEAKFRMPQSVEVAGDHPIKWAGSLGANATIINDRRVEKVGSESDFQSKIAGPSSAGFSQFVTGSTYITRGGRSVEHITEAQGKNLGSPRMFSKWSRALDYMFETVDGVPAKRYLDMVNNKVENVADAWAVKGLRITGDKIRGLGLATIAAYFLTGDTRALGLVRPDDIIVTAPISGWTGIIKDGFNNAFKAAFVQKVIQAGMLIDNANWLLARQTEQNALLNGICDGFRDVLKALPFLPTNDDSFCKYVLVDTQAFLHVKVSLL